MAINPSERVSTLSEMFLHMKQDQFRNEVTHAKILSCLGCGPLITAVHDHVYVYSQQFAGRSMWRVLSCSTDIDVSMILGNVFLRSFAMSLVKGPQGMGIRHNDLSISNVCITTGVSDTIALFDRTYEFEGFGLKFIDCGMAKSSFYKIRSNQDVQDLCLFPNCVIDPELDTVNPLNFLSHVRRILASCSFCNGFAENVHVATMRNMLDFQHSDFVIFCVSILQMLCCCEECRKIRNLTKYDEKVVRGCIEMLFSEEFNQKGHREKTYAMMDYLKVPYKTSAGGARCDLDYNIKAVELSPTMFA